MRVLAAVFAIAAGLLVLLGYFIPTGILLEIRQVLVEWAVILAAVAVLVGVTNLFSVHWNKIRTHQKGNVYSALLILSLFTTTVLGILFGTESPALRFSLNAIILPAETTLMALLAITLVYASVRLLHHHTDLMSFIFLVVVVVVLLASAPLPFGKVPVLSDIVLPWLTQIFAVAGARGILIGMALGALVTGLRVLFGVDRPYGGN